MRAAANGASVLHVGSRGANFRGRYNRDDCRLQFSNVMTNLEKQRSDLKVLSDKGDPMHLDLDLQSNSDNISSPCLQ